MRTMLLIGLCACGAALAQPTLAPSPENVGPPSGRTFGDYNIVDSFEAGYRFLDLTGDLGKYRSDVNYGNGLRLLSGSFSMYSKDGHGALFDAFVIRTQGLGDDPYEFSSLHVEKNKLYRYDLVWRLNDYFNPALAIANGQHLIDTERRIQDHDLTIFPQSKFKLFVGYSRNSQQGPALSTIQLFNDAGNEFPLFVNVRRLENEYRLGAEIDVLGVRLNVMHGWVNSSEMTPYTLAPSTLSQFARTEPYRGSSPYWRLNLHKETKDWSVGARYTYASSHRGFFFNEFAAGPGSFGAAASRQTLVSGDARRPVATGDLNITLFPASRLTIANQTSFYNTRMDGDNSYLEVDNASSTFTRLNFQFLSVRTIANTTDITYRVAKWFSTYGGYAYSARRILSNETAVFFGLPQSLSGEQNNHVHAGLLGLRFQPLRPLTFKLDAEVGRGTRPIFPIAGRDYRALGARVQYKTRSLLLSGVAKSNTNINSVSVSEHSSRAKTYGLDAAWTARSWLSLDASYAKLHLDTVSGIAYFASGAFITGDRSIYISNIHSGNLTARVSMGSRADLSLGYSRIQDTGDGRANPLASPEGGSSSPVFLAAQTFPLTFGTPLARLSLKIHEKMRWNAGYQYYHYSERFQPLRYRAQTGFTSLSWSF